MSDAPLRVEVTLDDSRGEGWRVDRYVSEAMGLFSRSQVGKRVVEARVNGRPAKLSRRLHAGDRLELLYRLAPAMDLAAEEMALDVIYEDGRLIVLDKPQGLVVHPACGHPTGTLVNGLLWRFTELRDAFGAENPRPGIVHRLDKDTSGVLVVAKDPRTHEALARQFKERTARKLYLAILRGAPEPEEGRVETRIARDPRNRKLFAVCESGGKQAVTDYRVLRRIGEYSVVSFRPRTGRTHQIRVHARHLGCPILGDPLYGRRGDPEWGLMLHAFRLRISLPAAEGGSDERRTFTAPLPERFRECLRAISRSPS